MFENLRAFVRRGGWEPQCPLPFPPLFDFLLFLLNFFWSQLPSGLPFLGLGLFCQSCGNIELRMIMTELRFNLDLAYHTAIQYSRRKHQVRSFLLYLGLGGDQAIGKPRIHRSRSRCAAADFSL